MTALIATACCTASFIAVAGLNWLSLIPWRKSHGDHWTERARVLWTARVKSNLLTLYIPLLVAAGSSILWKCPITGVALRWLPGFAGALGACWFMAKEVFPGLVLRSWLYDMTVGWALRLGKLGVFIAIGFSMPDRFGPRVWLLLAAAVMLQVTWEVVALPLLRLLGIFKPPGERLRKIVANGTAGGGPRVRWLWQAGGVMANAYAFPLSGTLVFLDPLLEILTDDEVAAICAHELGHLAESKRILFGRYLGAMAVLPLLLIKPVCHLGESKGWLPGGLLILLLVVICLSRLSRRMRRIMEIRADEIARHAQTDDGVYARALEKLCQNNQMPVVLPGKNQTHPDLYDRMIAAGVTPDYWRPLPPARFHIGGWLLLIASPLIVVWVIVNW